MSSAKVWFFSNENSSGCGLTDEGAEIMKELGYKVWQKEIFWTDRK